MSVILASLLQKIAIQQKDPIIDSILEKYYDHASVTINFIYYANLRFLRDKNYLSALLESDFLLPDGIALRLLWSRFQTKGFLDFLLHGPTFLTHIPNHNGTDFVPYFLRTINGKKERARVFLYGGMPETVRTAQAKLESQFPEYVFASQHGYAPLDLSLLEQFFDSEKTGMKEILPWPILPQDHTWYPRGGIYNILLVGLGTPKQELWIADHRSLFEHSHLLIFSVGGLFDFISESENRAPKFIRNLNLEWLFRVVTNPRKNALKTLHSIKVFWDLCFPPR